MPSKILDGKALAQLAEIDIKNKVSEDILSKLKAWFIALLKQDDTNKLITY